MTFDVEAQQQEQLQQLQQQMLLQPVGGIVGPPLLGYLPQSPLAAPETFAQAAAYGRGKSSFPQWAVFLIIVGVALIFALCLCCCFCSKCRLF